MKTAACIIIAIVILAFGLETRNRIYNARLVEAAGQIKKGDSQAQVKKILGEASRRGGWGTGNTSDGTSLEGELWIYEFKSLKKCISDLLYCSGIMNDKMYFSFGKHIGVHFNNEKVVERVSINNG